MSMEETIEGGTAFIKLSDEMTIYTAAELKQQLFASWDRAQEVEVDLSEVTEIDSSGIQLLMLLKHEGEICSKPVRYVQHSKPVISAMELLGLTTRFADPVVLSADMGR